MRGLILELLSVVPFLCALPPLFHQLANSTLLHTKASGAVDLSLGLSEIIPAFAILPFMLYQLSGFGTLGYIVSKTTNWAINIGILVLIIGAYITNRTGRYSTEEIFTGLLVVLMTITVFYGVLKLKRMHAVYEAHVPAKAPKESKSGDSGKTPTDQLDQ